MPFRLRILDIVINKLVYTKSRYPLSAILLLLLIPLAAYLDNNKLLGVSFIIICFHHLIAVYIDSEVKSKGLKLSNSVYDEYIQTGTYERSRKIDGWGLFSFEINESRNEATISFHHKSIIMPSPFSTGSQLKKPSRKSI